MVWRERERNAMIDHVRLDLAARSASSIAAMSNDAV